MPWRRLRTLIRPSQPVRHFWAFLNHRFFWRCLRCGLLLDWLGTATRRTPSSSAELVRSDLSPKTIQKHVDNLWALGGEMIRNLNEDPPLRQRPIDRILDDKIDEDG